MTALAIIAVCATIVIWLIWGAFNDRVRQSREETDSLIDAYDKNRRADNDPDVDKRVRDFFKKRN